MAGQLPWGRTRSPEEPDRNLAVSLQSVTFICPKEHEFQVPFADDADLPATWECRQHGTESPQFAAPPSAKYVKPPRTHWDMLLERRTIPELEALLTEALSKHRA
ncbi:MAG: RNA polymerase-binding protein RbpA [Umezawaea sp.]